jgi:hypothetical protein
MAIVIGLVLHESHRPVFEDAARTLSGVDVEWVTYEREDAIRPGVGGLLARTPVDGLLLGPVPYAHSRDLLPADLPVVVTRSAGMDLALAFGRALAKGWPATPVSIDTFDQDTVDEVARGLGLDRDQVSSLPYDPDQPVDEIISFHRRASAGCVISVRTAVTAALDGEVPVLSAQPGPATIRTQLHDLVLRVRSRLATAQRFAAGLFLVTGSGADLDRARIGLQNLLHNTPEFADAWIENRDRRGVVVFGHQALFEEITHNWVTLPVLGQAQEALKLRVAAGFGVGPSARTSVHLAERAAARAEQESGPCAYLIEDGGVIIGPMGLAESPLTFTYREHAPGLERLARRAGLSPATLSRLAALEGTLDGRPISPSDLAKSLGITDPSGRRLIRKLGESGLVVEEGSAQVHRRGRPTHLYRLAITAALANP